MSDEILNFMVSFLAYGGGSAAVAYLLFKWLGRTWIENKFAQRLEQLRHQQALELQRLRMEIDAILSGVLRLQEKEFFVLPEAWHKLNDAYFSITDIVRSRVDCPEMDRMNEAELQQFLDVAKLEETDKKHVRESQNRRRAYEKVAWRNRYNQVHMALYEFRTFVAKNGIFLPMELEELFSRISYTLCNALISNKIGMDDGGRDWKSAYENIKGLENEAEPLYKEIKVGIQRRLQLHARVPPASGVLGPAEGQRSPP